MCVHIFLLLSLTCTHTHTHTHTHLCCLQSRALFWRTTKQSPVSDHLGFVDKVMHVPSTTTTRTGGGPQRTSNIGNWFVWGETGHYWAQNFCRRHGATFQLVRECCTRLCPVKLCSICFRLCPCHFLPPLQVRYTCMWIVVPLFASGEAVGR